MGVGRRRLAVLVVGSLVAASMGTAGAAASAAPATDAGSVDAGVPAAPPDDVSVEPGVADSIEVMIDLTDFDGGVDAEAAADALEEAVGVDIDVQAAVAELGVVAATVTADGLEQVRSLPFVESAEILPRLLPSLDGSVPAIGAADLHARGETGAGRVVVVIDSGVDGSLPGVDVVAEACFLPSLTPDEGTCPSQTGVGAAAPCPDSATPCGHGSHIASIVTADGGSFTGVAPGASIIAIRVTSDAGDELDPAGVLLALDHVHDLRATFDIAAVNLSFGATRAAGESCGFPMLDEWQNRVAALVDAGIAVVASSGNRTPGGNWLDTPIEFPACLPDVISVGSTTDAGTVSDSSKSDADLDLVAPGDCIDSDRFDDLPGVCTRTSGTSFAAPHVAASFALLDRSRSRGEVDRTGRLLRTTGEMIARPSGVAGVRDSRYPEVRPARVVDFVPFDDAPTGAFWSTASDWARHTGVSKGVDATSFAPGRTLDRAQAVTLLWRFMGSPTGSPPAGFTDVVSGSFYADAVDWAKAAGVTLGTTTTRFSPGDPVTRAQVAAFIWRLIGSPAVAVDAGFADVEPGAFYAAAVEWMNDHDITGGTTPTTFSPDVTIDRGQIITFLYRLADAPEAWNGSVVPPASVLF